MELVPPHPLRGALLEATEFSSGALDFDSFPRIVSRGEIYRCSAKKIRTVRTLCHNAPPVCCGGGGEARVRGHMYVYTCYPRDDSLLAASLPTPLTWPHIPIRNPQVVLYRDSQPPLPLAYGELPLHTLNHHSSLEEWVPLTTNGSSAGAVLLTLRLQQELPEPVLGAHSDWTHAIRSPAERVPSPFAEPRALSPDASPSYRQHLESSDRRFLSFSARPKFHTHVDACTFEQLRDRAPLGTRRKPTPSARSWAPRSYDLACHQPPPPPARTGEVSTPAECAATSGLRGAGRGPSGKVSSPGRTWKQGVHNLLVQFFTLDSSKIEVFETYFF